MGIVIRLFVFYWVFSALVVAGSWDMDKDENLIVRVVAGLFSLAFAPIIFPVLLGMMIKEIVWR